MKYPGSCFEESVAIIVAVLVLLALCLESLPRYSCPTLSIVFPIPALSLAGGVVIDKI